jgi:hypothetical protein
MSESSQDEITVLKRINSTGKTTPNDLALELGEPYTVQGLSTYLQSLEGKKLLRKTQENPSTYELTPMGLITIGVLPEAAKKVYMTVPQEKCFYFYSGIGPDKFANLSACSLADFEEKAKKVEIKSLEFHTQRGDLAKWFRDVLDETELARDFDRLRSANLSGEILRNRVVRLLENRIERLTYGTTGV